MSTEAQLLEKLAMARAIIRHKAPYYMSTVFSLIPYMLPGLATLGVTEGMVLMIDPEWGAKISDEEMAGALVHEVGHVLRDHLARMANMADHELANKAGDLAMNPDILAEGWKLPHYIIPKMYGFADGLTTEEYYELLVQKKHAGGGKSQQGQQPDTGPQQGRQQGSGQGSGGAPGGGPPTQPGQQKSHGGGGQGQGNPTQGKQQGGGGGGNPGPQQQPQPGKGQGQSKGQGKQEAPGQAGSGTQGDPAGDHPGVGTGRCGGIARNGFGDIERKVDQEVGRSEAEKRAVVKQTLEEIKQHAAQYGRGSVPGSLLQAIEHQEKKGEVNWRQKLPAIIKKAAGRIEAGGMDYSLARPSKRSYARRMPRPGLVQYLPEVAFILDTSASMGEEQIIDAIVELISIFKSLGIDAAWFLQADADVAKNAQRIRMRDLMSRVKIHGRGGTHFDPALRALMKLNPKPELAVYLTDGDGSVTFKPPGMEVIWCVVRSPWGRKPPCDWGHVVMIDNEVAARGGARTSRRGARP